MNFGFFMCKIQLKLHLKLTLRANPMNNETCIPLFMGLALTESLNVLLFYICNVQNAYNPKPNDDYNNDLNDRAIVLRLPSRSIFFFSKVFTLNLRPT